MSEIDLSSQLDWHFDNNQSFEDMCNSYEGRVILQDDWLVYFQEVAFTCLDEELDQDSNYGYIVLAAEQPVSEEGESGEIQYYKKYGDFNEKETTWHIKGFTRTEPITKTIEITDWT